MLSILEDKSFCLVEHKELDARQEILVLVSSVSQTLLIDVVTCEHADR